MHMDVFINYLSFPMNPTIALLNINKVEAYTTAKLCTSDKCPSWTFGKAGV